jgi:hypothetical protein
MLYVSLGRHTRSTVSSMSSLVSLWRAYMVTENGMQSSTSGVASSPRVVPSSRLQARPSLPTFS